MKEEISCGTIVINDNKVLLIEQKQGFMGFPKGHIEKNENFIETAIRETKEETNIDVEIISNVQYKNQYIINNKINKTVIYFLAKPLNNDIKIQEKEVNKALWVNIEEVKNNLTFDNLKELWEKIYLDIKKN